MRPLRARVHDGDSSHWVTDNPVSSVIVFVGYYHKLSQCGVRPILGGARELSFLTLEHSFALNFADQKDFHSDVLGQVL